MDGIYMARTGTEEGFLETTFPEFMGTTREIPIMDIATTTDTENGMAHNTVDFGKGSDKNRDVELGE
jgi:hypothetical protein